LDFLKAVGHANVIEVTGPVILSAVHVTILQTETGTEGN
jgi:hypothetical protein